MSMETVKEIQKKTLIADIEGVIAEQEKVAKDAMKDTESRFMGGEEYGKYLDTMGAASFAIGFLGSIKEKAERLTVKESILLIQWHLHNARKCAKGEDIFSYHAFTLSQLLEGLEKRAEERREWEIDPPVPKGNYGVYWMDRMEDEAMIAAYDTEEDARRLALGESGGNATLMTVYNRSTSHLVAAFHEGKEVGAMAEAV